MDAAKGVRRYLILTLEEHKRTHMSEKDDFFLGLEELGETEVRSRVKLGRRSPYQGKHMDWAIEWFDKLERKRSEEKEKLDTELRKDSINTQKQSNRIGWYALWVAVGLLIVTAFGIYVAVK